MLAEAPRGGPRARACGLDLSTAVVHGVDVAPARLHELGDEGHGDNVLQAEKLKHA